MNKYLKLLFVILLNLVFYSCNKENAKPEKILVSKIRSLDGIGEEIGFFYDNMDRIQKRVRYSDSLGNIEYSELFYYYPDGKLRKIEGYGFGTHLQDSTVYEYLSETKCRSTLYAEHSHNFAVEWEILNQTIWISNLKGEIIADSTTYKNKTSSYDTFEYDDKGNCTKKYHNYKQCSSYFPFEEQQHCDINEFEYNYNLGQFYYVDFILGYPNYQISSTNTPPFIMMKNFFSKVISTYTPGVSDTLTFTYEANSKNFPNKMYRHTFWSIPESWVFFYKND